MLQFLIVLACTYKCNEYLYTAVVTTNLTHSSSFWVSMFHQMLYTDGYDVYEFRNVYFFSNLDAFYFFSCLTSLDGICSTTLDKNDERSE